MLLVAAYTKRLSDVKHQYGTVSATKYQEFIRMSSLFLKFKLQSHLPAATLLQILIHTTLNIIHSLTYTSTVKHIK